jgi:hypothetical protein
MNWIKNFNQIVIFVVLLVFLFIIGYRICIKIYCGDFWGYHWGLDLALQNCDLARMIEETSGKPPDQQDIERCAREKFCAYR